MPTTETKPEVTVLHLARTGEDAGNICGLRGEAVEMKAFLRAPVAHRCPECDQIAEFS